MKNVICSLAAGIALVFASRDASAGGSTLHDRLTQDEGLALVSDGLYAESTEDGESLVATNAQGIAPRGVPHSHCVQGIQFGAPHPALLRLMMAPLPTRTCPCHRPPNQPK
jgi:hypothetical protein